MNSRKNANRLLQFKDFQFFYILLTLLSVTVLVYFLILPKIFPSLHHGLGMLKGGDWIHFHEKSVALASLIRANGWSEWMLLPERQAPIGISSFLYAATGVNHPILPAIVQVFIYSAGVFFAHKFLQFSVSNRSSIPGLFIFLFMPSSVMIYTQIHKDPYTVSAFFIFLFGFLQVRKSIFTALLYFGGGLLLASLFRFYLLEIYAALATICLIGLLILDGGKKFQEIILIIVSLWLFVFSAEKLAEGPDRRSQALNVVSIIVDVSDNVQTASHNRQILPGVTVTDHPNMVSVDWFVAVYELEQKLVTRVNAVRKGFVTGHPTAGTNIDVDVRFKDFNDMISYIPRALLIGLFAPLPSVWMNDGYTLNSSAYRLVGALESLTFYTGCALLCFVAWRRRKHLSSIDSRVVAALCFCILYCLVVGLLIPNQGAVIRMRIAPWLLLNGAIWSLVITHFVHVFSKAR